MPLRPKQSSMSWRESYEPFARQREFHNSSAKYRLFGGAAGPGRMRFVGPFVPDVLVHAVTACGVGALLGAGVVALLNRRATQARVAGADAEAAGAPDAPGVTASEPVED